jgi:uroporphyrinogen decarboxylase
MNHKQLVQAAIDHHRTGALPYDVFEGWMWPGIAAKLVQAANARDYEDLLTNLGACCRWVTVPYIGPALPEGAANRVASPHTRYSLNGSIWGLKPGIKEHGTGSAGHPLAHAETEQHLLEHSWPSPDWFDYASLSTAANRYQDDFVIFGGFSPVFYLMADLCGMEKTLIDLATNETLSQCLVHKITDFYKAYFTRVAEAGKGSIDAIAFGDDFASQASLLFSPALWRKYFKPVWQELFAIARSNGLKVFFHSCGAVCEIIPDLIDVGLDVLYPIQPAARNMGMEDLQQKFGSNLTFYGGFDVQGILPFGTPQQIRSEVARLHHAVNGQGNYILATSHVIMEDVAPENVLALYETAQELGR